jgi:hypothetical protein
VDGAARAGEQAGEDPLGLDVVVEVGGAGDPDAGWVDVVEEAVPVEPELGGQLRGGGRREGFDDVGELAAEDAVDPPVGGDDLPDVGDPLLELDEEPAVAEVADPPPTAADSFPVRGKASVMTRRSSRAAFTRRFPAAVAR